MIGNQSILLYGGSGYVGMHLTREFIRLGYKVFNMDLVVPPVQPAAAVCLDISQDPANQDTHFRDSCRAAIHLACPRNRPGWWDWNLAERALVQGMEVFDALLRPEVPRYFASSWSIKDVPDNEYARFKRMAEMVVERADYRVLRFPTLFGAEPGLPVRADLGLNRVAMQQVKDMQARPQPPQAWVNCSAVRHLMSVPQLAHRVGLVVRQWLDPEILSRGRVQFAEVVPQPIKLIANSDGYTTTHGNSACREHVVECRFWYDALIHQLKGGKVELI